MRKQNKEKLSKMQIENLFAAYFGQISNLNKKEKKATTKKNSNYKIRMFA